MRRAKAPGTVGGLGAEADRIRPAGGLAAAPDKRRAPQKGVLQVATPP
jgi:hypothetical protein